MKYYLGLITCILASSVFAQIGKLNKADDYYNKLSYHLAEDLYEDLLATELATPILKANLAHCYFAQGNLSDSEKMYREVINSSNLSNEHYFNFAQVLKQLGNYTESDNWMNVFYEKNNSDKRAISFNDNTDYLQKIEAEGIHFEIKLASYNSTAADFGGYQFPKDQSNFIISSRKKRLIKNIWSWNGSSFLDIYKVMDNDQVINFFSRSINTSYHEGPICFTPDLKNVYYTRNNTTKGKNRRDENGIQNLKLYCSEVDENGKWINSRELAINSKDFSIGHPAIMPNGNTIYFVSDMPGGFGGADLYKGKIEADGSISEIVNLGAEINTEGQEMFPWVSPEGHLYFSSNGHVGLGGLDVFVCNIEKDGHSKIVNCGRPLNTMNDDFAINYNSDGITGQFSSNRADGVGEDDIYQFKLIKPFVFSITVSGIILEQETNDILAGATITLFDENGHILEEVEADAQGNYSFSLKPGASYSIQATKEDFKMKSTTVSIPADASDPIQKDLALVKVPNFELYGLIKDNKNGKLLDSVDVRITDLQTGALIFEGTTSTNGDFNQALENMELNQSINYEIQLNKAGYLGKTTTLSMKVEQAGVINVHEKLDIGLGKVEIGIDLASIIEIKPIYFDLGKSNIRKDAAIELDKIIKVMNDYPTMVIELGSHTDCRSSQSFNMALSTRRANASANYIKKRITNPARISGKGYGESKLKIDCPCEGAVKSNCSEEEHQQNRRTEFIIIQM